jgi:protease-4
MYNSIIITFFVFKLKNVKSVGHGGSLLHERKAVKKAGGNRNVWVVLFVLGVLVCVGFTVGLLYLLFTSVNFGEFGLGDKVAVIPIKGEITSGGCSGGIFGTPACADVTVIELDKANEDDSVRAIVLDINSGGGSVVPSRDLARAVKESKKPVVSYIGESGASGAYYIASASRHIVADRDSITGSIGVIMTIQHTYGLYDKLGINVTTIKSGKVKDIGSPYRPMTDEEKKELEAMVSKIYADFVSDVAINRGLERDYVERISDGSIYLGKDAKDLGLIDSLGNLQDAVNIAAELGNVSGKPEVQKNEAKQLTLWDLFASKSLI